MSLLGWVRFETPGYLALFALLPLLIMMSLRSLAGLGAIRRTMAVALRCLVVAVMVLALAGAQRTRPIDDLAVIFLLDRSRSIPGDMQEEAFAFVRSAGEAIGTNARVGVVAFDGAADVEQTPSRALALDRLSEPYQPDRTNIAAAARLAMALLPSDSAGRVVLLTDGNENVDAVLEEVEQYGAAGIPIDVLPVTYDHGNEVIFESLQTPPTAGTDETIDVQMVLRSQQRTRGEIRLYHNEEPVDLNGTDAGTGWLVELDPGPNRFSRQLGLRYAGPHRFRAEFVPAEAGADVLLENNVGRAFTIVSGPGRILILTNEEDYALGAERSSARILARALETEKLTGVVEVAGANPVTRDRLVGYAAVILNDVPANVLRAQERETLAVYVRELGGGLVMIGGQNSFGAGGWLGSPVEEVMPVSFDIKHKKQFMRGALVLVMHACEIERGNYIGQRCAIEAVKSLSSRDLVGILAWQWQGDLGHWVVPLQTVGDRGRIIAAIKAMSMGDMPYLDEVMRPGVQALIEKGVRGPKHMIVISDFDPQPPKDDLIATMRDRGVTCSTIAIGYGSHYINEPLARKIAAATSGRFYRTNDFSKLPQIFVKESREIRRSLVQEGRFTPLMADALSPVVPGLADAPLPELYGLVLTTARPMASTPIVRMTEDEQQDPVLAHWQVGLGKTLAFTSGLWTSWGQDWRGWERFRKFWAQAARWVSRAEDAAAFDVSTSIQGGRATLRVDAVDKDAQLINTLQIAGRLTNPDNTGVPLRLVQTGPGRYEAEFDVQDPGNYIFNLKYALRRAGVPVEGTLQSGIAIAYSPEYRDLAANIPLLEEIVERTGGRRLDRTQPAAVFDRAGLTRAEARRPMWEALVHWALMLFLLDVAIRRIAINPVELARKLRGFVRDMAGRGRPAAEAEAVLTTLKGTRERLREEQAATPEPEAGPAPTARYEAEASQRRTTEELGKALGGATEQDAPVVARPTGRKPAQSEGDYTSRLLKAKRRARDEMKKDDEETQDQQ